MKFQKDRKEINRGRFLEGLIKKGLQMLRSVLPCETVKVVWSAAAETIFFYVKGAFRLRAVWREAACIWETAQKRGFV